ncbi:3297_t:CDS:2 [Gigaspora rosea]|nr:3297_t:CDS:2 [Gigaspora rosea]
MAIKNKSLPKLNVLNEVQPGHDNNNDITVDNENLPKYADLPQDKNIFEHSNQPNELD